MTIPLEARRAYVDLLKQAETATRSALASAYRWGLRTDCLRVALEAAIGAVDNARMELREAEAAAATPRP